MVLYYFAESFKVYNNLAIALLTVSIAIFAIMIPYLNRLKNKYSLDKVSLETEKKHLKVDKIVERYNEIDIELGNLKNLKWLLTASMIFYAIVIFFSAWFLNAGAYSCLDMPGCQNSPENNFSPVWAIEKDAKVFMFTAENFVNYVPIGFLIAFLILIWIIFRVYKITENVAQVELEELTGKIK
ncbi:MAG: hypothetical protein ACFFG0_30595 [Candidatus Thorarchaeota archaeon]